MNAVFGVITSRGSHQVFIRRLRYVVPLSHPTMSPIGVQKGSMTCRERREKGRHVLSSEREARNSDFFVRERHVGFYVTHPEAVTARNTARELDPLTQKTTPTPWRPTKTKLHRLRTSNDHFKRLVDAKRDDDGRAMCTTKSSLPWNPTHFLRVLFPKKTSTSVGKLCRTGHTYLFT